MIRLEVPAKLCSQDGCNGKCGYVQLNLIGLKEYAKPNVRVDLYVGVDSDLARTSKLKVVVSDERPTADPHASLQELRDGSIDKYAENPCTAWEAFIRALYFGGYRWFWFEKDEAPPENEVKTP